MTKYLIIPLIALGCLKGNTSKEIKISKGIVQRTIQKINTRSQPPYLNTGYISRKLSAEDHNRSKYYSSYQSGILLSSLASFYILQNNSPEDIVFFNKLSKKPDMNMDTNQGLPRRIHTNSDFWLDYCEHEYSLALQSRQKLHKLDVANHDDVISEFNEMQMHLWNAINPSMYLLQRTSPSLEAQDKASVMTQKATTLESEIWNDIKIYNKIKSVPDDEINPSTRTWRDKILRRYVREGINKTSREKKKIIKLKTDITSLENEFGNILKKDIRQIKVGKEEIEALPETVRAKFPIDESGKATVTTRKVDYIPFITYSPNSQIKQALWKLRGNRAYPQNINILKDLLIKRYSLALLLGYSSYAHYIINEDDYMSKSPERSMDFMLKKYPSVTDRFNDLIRQISAYKSSVIGNSDLNPWDYQYWLGEYQKYKSGDPSIDKKIPQYFQIDSVKTNLLAFAEEMYDIRFNKIDYEYKLHESVESYEVLNNYGHRIAIAHMDLYPRENKYQHSCVIDIRQGVDGKQIPEFMMIMNITQPQEGNDGLMELSEYGTLVHEFGHWVHAIFANQKFLYNSGIMRVQSDFLEVPSMLNEISYHDKDILKRIAKHYKTPQPIPDQYLDYIQSKIYDEYSFLDQILLVRGMHCNELHTTNPHLSGFDIRSIEEEVYKNYGPFFYHPDISYTSNFIHLGYSYYCASYYLYFWSQIIGEEIYKEMLKLGVDNPEVYRRYRNELLSVGGSISGEEMIENFMGK